MQRTTFRHAVAAGAAAVGLSLLCVAPAVATPSDEAPGESPGQSQPSQGPPQGAMDPGQGTPSGDTGQPAQQQPSDSGCSLPLVCGGGGGGGPLGLPIGG